MLTGLRLAVLILSISLWTPVFSQTPTAAPSPSSSRCANFEELKIKYFKANQYSEFIGFLDNFRNKDKQTRPCINYYKALARYSQLKYLEEKQSWDDYFANGNDYRSQIIESAKKVVAETTAGDWLRSKIRFLLWQFHRGQQDVFSEQALTDLMADVNAYAKESNGPMLIKDIADSLLASEEKAKAKELYKLYVDKFLLSATADAQIKAVAAGFYKEANLELAQTVYDIYIERVSKSLSLEKLIPELFEIASMFVYKASGLHDMTYAEKIYTRIEGLAPLEVRAIGAAITSGDLLLTGLGQKNAFNQGTIYLRAFNLEKMKDYKKAAELYLQLIQLYPETKYFEEAVYKIAMINAYVSADIKEARNYFEKLTAKPKISPQRTSGFYQLGLLAQWEGDKAQARDYYNALIKDSGDNQPVTVAPGLIGAAGTRSCAALAGERLKEIEENKPLSYNLRTFLDASFKDADASLEMSRSALEPSVYILEKGQKVTVSSVVNLPESGCSQVEVQYLWSGNLGGANPGVTDADFQGSYPDAGTKEINLIIVLPTGIVDRSFAMVDVY